MERGIKYITKRHVQMASGLNYLLFCLLNIYTSLWFHHVSVASVAFFCFISYANIYLYSLLTRHVKYLYLLLWILLYICRAFVYEVKTVRAHEEQWQKGGKLEGIVQFVLFQMSQKWWHTKKDLCGSILV